MIEIEQHHCFNFKILQSIHTRSINRRIFLCRHKKLASPKTIHPIQETIFVKKSPLETLTFLAQHLVISLEDDLGLLLSYIFFSSKKCDVSWILSSDYAAPGQTFRMGNTLHIFKHSLEQLYILYYLVTTK